MISDKLVLVVSSLIQVSVKAKRSVLLSEINFAMAGYLLFIDLMFACDIQTPGWSWVWVNITSKEEKDEEMGR